MIALGIETSARVGSVALLVDGRVESRELAAKRQARSLAHAIDELLSAERLTPRDLGLVAVSIGPGGYTGLRLGLATAKTLVRVLDKPLIGVPSTEVQAASDGLPLGVVLAVLDARKGFLYGARYERRHEAARPVELDPPFCRPIVRVTSMWNPETYVIGDGLPLLRAALPDVRGDAEAKPTAADLLRVACERHAAGESHDESTVLPLYLRPSEAELRWRERNASAGDEPGKEGS